MACRSRPASRQASEGREYVWDGGVFWSTGWVPRPRSESGIHPEQRGPAPDGMGPRRLTGPRRPGTTHTGTTHTVQDQSSLFSARLPGLCSGVSTALWGRLQLLFGLRAGVGCCLLERVTEAQLEAAPWLTPAPGHRRAPCRPGAEKGNPGAGAPTGTETVGSSAGSWPPFSRNLEKVSRSLVLLYSIT